MKMQLRAGIVKTPTVYSRTFIPHVSTIPPYVSCFRPHQSYESAKYTGVDCTDFSAGILQARRYDLLVAKFSTWY